MKTHHVDEAKQDGGVNQAVALQHTLEACALIAAGQVLIVSMTQKDAPAGPSGKKRIERTFVVEEQ